MCHTKEDIMKIHLRKGKSYSWDKGRVYPTACGLGLYSNTTNKVKDTTCKSCKRTKEYKGEF